jgi:hypothetical protein
MTQIISELEKYSNQLNIVRGHYVELVTVPPGLPSNDPIRQDYDDRSIDGPKKNGSIWLTVKNIRTKEIIAHAVFSAGGDELHCDSISSTSENEIRGLPIFMELWNFAQTFFGITSTSILPDGMKWPTSKSFDRPRA